MNHKQEEKGALRTVETQLPTHDGDPSRIREAWTLNSASLTAPWRFWAIVAQVRGWLMTGERCKAPVLGR